MFVWRSTDASVQALAISFTAFLEIALALFLFFLFSELFHSEVGIVIYIFFAPLLLLRSDSSTELGARWFREYVNRSFSEPLASRANLLIRPPFWISVVVALASGFVAGLATSWVGARVTSVAAVLEGPIIGYASVQFALAVTVASAARNTVVIAKRQVLAGAFGLILALGIGAASYLVKTDLFVSGMAFVTSFVIALSAVIIAPQVIYKAAASDKTLDGVEIVRAMIAASPALFAMFVPGFFGGTLLRAVLIRFGATILNLTPGVIALPQNWRRSLLSIDLFYPPELVRGYTGDTAFDIRYVRRRFVESDGYRRIVYAFGLVILYSPAYIYRLGIKASFYLYFPFVYLARPLRRSVDPKALSHLILHGPVERVSQIAAVLTVLFSAYATCTHGSISFYVGQVNVIAPLEYLLFIDISRLHLWQILSIFGVIMTACIFVLMLQVQTLYESKSESRWVIDDVNASSKRAEYCIRIRNICSIVFSLIVVLHAAVYDFGVGHVLPPTLRATVEGFYGARVGG